MIFLKKFHLNFHTPRRVGGWEGEGLHCLLCKVVGNLWASKFLGSYWKIVRFYRIKSTHCLKCVYGHRFFLPFLCALLTSFFIWTFLKEFYIVKFSSWLQVIVLTDNSHIRHSNLVHLVAVRFAYRLWLAW